MKRGSTVRYEASVMGGETVRAFVPAPLPADPPVELSGAYQRSLERALLACGRLDGAAVVHILDTLDDKIEPNRQMNETLEESARAIFESWFVDFDPVRAKAEGRDPCGIE